ncbi:hypothetical protein KFE25_010617 [Diacronema lutheri]|uniref:Exostosin GT47 domain-containing protein n=2 Tax=Diacronema lutheri TaxID=2081491 RepID=A0A8J5XEM9_DIALT|nr:hypothetical protein KFE25_010617 [Diacronema lutheri]
MAESDVRAEEEDDETVSILPGEGRATRPVPRGGSACTPARVACGCFALAAAVAAALAAATLLARLEPRRRPSAGSARNSTFDHGCGQRGRVGECPGYAECLREISGFDEIEYLASLRAARAGPPPLHPGRRWCTKSSCIDRATCAQPFRLFQYAHADVAHLPLGEHCLAESNLTDARARGLLTRDPARACAFWFELKRNCAHLHQLRELPHWRGNGLNHVFVQHDWRGIDAQTRERHFGRAMVAQGASLEDRFVPGLDIALGLHPKLLPSGERGAQLAALEPWRRRYLLTFKGTESHVSRIRASLHHDETRGVVLAYFPSGVHCAASTSLARPYAHDGRVALPLLHADCCARMLKLFRAYDYVQLMNSTFALVMRGDQPASFRLAEVLAHGCVPVFYGFDETVLPWAELIDWPALSLSVPFDVDFERALYPLLEALLRDRPRLLRMQREVRRAFAHFETLDARAGDLATVEVVRRRFSYVQ